MNETRQTRWTSAFADATDAVFAAIAAPEIALAGSVFERPAEGVDSVWGDVANIERPQRLPRDHRQKFFEGIPEGLMDRRRSRLYAWPPSNAKIARYPNHLGGRSCGRVPAL